MQLSGSTSCAEGVGKFVRLDDRPIVLEGVDGRAVSDLIFLVHLTLEFFPQPQWPVSNPPVLAVHHDYSHYSTQSCISEFVQRCDWATVAKKQWEISPHPPDPPRPRPEHDLQKLASFADGDEQLRRVLLRRVNLVEGCSVRGCCRGTIGFQCRCCFSGGVSIRSGVLRESSWRTIKFL